MPFSVNRAPNYTHVAVAQTDSVIAGGGTINVYGITCANTNSSAETVTITEGDGSTVIMTIQVPPNATFESSTLFLADAGVNITTPTTTVCTIWHGNAGA